ncbi:MAG: hypothetical protein FWE13_01680 [Firmicutes bacterium]|nr:hypothetical protein [Bacillota bacterium]
MQLKWCLIYFGFSTTIPTTMNFLNYIRIYMSATEASAHASKDSLTEII